MVCRCISVYCIQFIIFSPPAYTTICDQQYDKWAEKIGKGEPWSCFDTMKFENKLFLLRYTYLQNKNHRLCIVWQKARADKMSCKSQTLQENNHLSYHCESKSRKHQESLFHGRTLKKGFVFFSFTPQLLWRSKPAEDSREELRASSSKSFPWVRNILYRGTAFWSCMASTMSVSSSLSRPGQVISYQKLAI